MALELPFILGTSQEHAAITLYSFLQQNILFEAFSGRLSGDSTVAIQFLTDTTTVFSMIGLLVLLFSPSLWRAKYIVSWSFLFLLVTLGASSGPEFSYNFNQAEKIEFLNTNIDGDTAACDDADRQAGACYKRHPNEAVVDRYMHISPTTGEVVSGKELLGTNKLEVVDGQVQQLSVLGFLPQVYIIYATNRFKYHLEEALYDLKTRNFNKKKQMLQRMLTAKTPNAQIDMWLALFDQACAHQTGVDTATLLTQSKNDTYNIVNANKFTETFTIGDLVPLLSKGTIIENYNKLAIAPLMDIFTANRIDQASINAATEIINETLAEEKKKKASIDFDKDANMDDALRQYTLNHPHTSTSKWYTFWKRTEVSIDNVKSLQSFNMQAEHSKVKEQFEFSKSAKNVDKSQYSANGLLLKDTDMSKLQAHLIMPLYLTTRPEIAVEEASSGSSADLQGGVKTTNDPSYDTVSADGSISSINSNVLSALKYMPEETVNAGKVNVRKSGFIRIDSCKRFYIEMLEYYNHAMKVDNSVFSDKVQLAASNSTIKKHLPRHIRAHGALLREIDIARRQCASEFSSNTIEANACTRKEAGKLINHYQKAAIRNSLAKDKRQTSEFYAKQFNSLRDGYTSYTHGFGNIITDFWTGPLVGLKALTVGIQAGAYSHILPIIKNIVLAFIIVCTPILFLLGLLVPSWAPGVIVTSLIAVLFLQMTDVIMVVVQSILISIEEPLKQLTTVASNDDDDYQAFMEVIWGMAYMSVFAITAFFMFAAGNTKQIMSQIAGLDKTVKSVSNEIYTEGLKMTKEIAKVVAGVVTGGTMGGATGLGAAKALAGATEFSKLAGAKGVMTAVGQTFGTREGNMAKLRQAHRDSTTETVTSEEKAKKEISKDYSEVLSNRSELVEQAKDSVDAKQDELTTKKEQRIANQTKSDVETQETRTYNDVIAPNTKKAMKRNQVDGPNSKSKKVDMNDPKTGIVTRQETFSPEDKVNMIYENNKKNDLTKDLSKNANIALSGASAYSIANAMKNGKLSADGLSYEFSKETDMKSMIAHARKSLEAEKTGLSKDISDKQIQAALSSALDKGGKSISHTVGGMNIEGTRANIVKQFRNEDSAKSTSSEPTPQHIQTANEKKEEWQKKRERRARRGKIT